MLSVETDRQFIQTYTYSTSSQHKLYNEICHMYLHICEIKNEQITVSLTVTIEKKNILHTHWLTRTYWDYESDMLKRVLLMCSMFPFFDSEKDWEDIRKMPEHATLMKDFKRSK